MHPRFLLLVVLLVAACAVEETPSVEDPAADEAALRALIDRTAALNNAADTTGWVALFEEGAVYMPPGSPAVTTRAGLEEAAAAGFGSYATEIRIVPDEIVVAGDWAFARSRVTGTATPRAGGEAVSVDVKQLVIYHRQADGAWKIARLITNSNG